MDHQSKNTLQFDIEEAEKFLSFIDPDATSFTFQTFDDDPKRKDPKLAKVFHGSLREHAPALVRLNELGAGIFVTVNETNLKGRKKEDIKRVRAVFVDLDGAPLEPVEQCPYPPQLIVETSDGKWHAYWLVDRLGLDEFSAVQTALVRKFDADPVVTDLPRVMRLPGFYHRKGTPRLVRIKTARPMIAPYTAELFRQLAGERVSTDKPNQSRGNISTSTPQGSDSTEGDRDGAQRVLNEQCAKVAEMPEGSKSRNNTLNRAAYTVGGLVGSGLLDEGEVRERLLVATDECGLTRKEANTTITSGLNAGRKSPWAPSLVLDPQDPMRSARKLVNTKYSHPSCTNLIHRHRETFWAWNGSCYELLTEEDVRAAVYRFAENARAMTKEGPGPFKPNKDKVANIVDALKAFTHLADTVDAPTWLAPDADLPPPNEFMSVANGLLHLPTGELWPPTPTFFNTAASSVAYDPDAPTPQRWISFLGEMFGTDVEAMQAMQEFFGYCLSTDTSQQKILLMVGPPRSGKGTSGNVLRQLVGNQFVAGPTISSLSGEFGLEPLIPRPVAIISDARIGARTDKAAVTERLLAISGEDGISVNRKNSSFWHGKLSTRFILIMNELPALADGSGALANRFIIVMLEHSRLGEEDAGLLGKLKPEMPGILNWAMEGYRRLQERGHFAQPTSSKEALQDIIRLGSPAHAFVSECCIVAPGKQIETEALWEHWKVWSKRNGHNEGSKTWFSRNIRSAVPGLKSVDRYNEKVRESWFMGIDYSAENDLGEQAWKKKVDSAPF